MSRIVLDLSVQLECLRRLDPVMIFFLSGDNLFNCLFLKGY